MARNVHLHVCFACDDNDGLARLARHYLSIVQSQAKELGREAGPGPHPDAYVGRLYGVRDAARYLEALADRSGPNPGWKGGLSLWGEISNHTDVLAFAETLRPFWRDLLLASFRSSQALGFQGGPYQFEHVVILYEDEGAEHASAVEIGLDDVEAAEQTGEGEVFIRHHPHLPFAWKQF